MLVKTEDTAFVKDQDSGAFINIDDEAYKKFKAAQAQAKKNREVCNRIDAVESDLKEIKDLLLQVLNGRN